MQSNTTPLIDTFGRRVTYLRLSVTDRCDLRCTYCMAERMTFLPRQELLTLEELERLSSAFIDRGVRKIRVTGGEPLVRRDILTLFDRLGARLGDDLDELTLTTNATQMTTYADRLVSAGVKRINVSLDTLRPDRFEEITRRGDLPKVMDGIKAALAAGLKVKINAVVLKDQNVDELPDMISWAHELGMDLTLIEIMPMGDTGEDRFDQYIPLTAVREGLEDHFTFDEIIQSDPMAGPSRYVRVRETGGKLGFITPLTNNFCAGCNRVRVTCTGRIYMCLGQDDHIDLREIMRQHSDDDGPLHEALDRALGAKPEKHDFEISGRNSAPSVTRHMSLTGG